MGILKERFSKSEFLFLTAYFIWLVFAAISLTYIKGLFEFADVRDVAYKLVWALLILKLWTDESFGKKGLIACLAAVVFFVICQNTDLDKMLLPFMLVLSARNVRPGHILGCHLLVHIPVTLFSFILSKNGLILNEIWGTGDRVRYALGYTFATYSSHLLMFFSLIYMSLKKKADVLSAAVLILLNLLLFTQTDTRTDIMLIIPAVCIWWILAVLKTGFRNRNLSRIVFASAGFIAAAASIYVQYAFDPDDSSWQKINNFVNGRVQLGHDAISDYQLTYFGQKIKWIGEGGIRLHPDWIYNYVDCSYLKYLLHYGIVFFVMLMAGIAIMGIWVSDSKNTGLQIAFLTWLAFGMIDAELFELAFQPFMLLLSVALFERTKEGAGRAVMVLPDDGGECAAGICR